MASTTVNGRATARATPGKFLGVTVNTAPPYNKYSVHDCIDPGQVSALNCIYPQNFASADGQTVKNGIVVHTQEAGGNFTVSHSS